jgi:lysophospholipase L1-like esterase
MLIAACAPSGDSTGGGGAAGTPSGGGTTGAGGEAGGATAGTTGTSGEAGTMGEAGTTGTTGTAGAAGTTGAGGGGRGGTTGAAGAAGTTGTGGGGRGGTTGTGGSAGTAGGGRGGTTGTGGAAGTGAGGRGGTTGAGGAAGTGTGGRGGASGAGGRGGTTGGGGRGGTTGGGGSSSVDAGNWDAPPLGSMVTIHVAGDSTAAIFPATDATMRVGWAAVLDPLFDNTVTVDDAALSGRSTKSYIDEGAWATLQAKINPGDYLFIEFGHNDEKTDDPTRYTDPATTYRDNLKVFINGARARGGFPVLLTSICRRQFSGTTVTGTHGAYTTAVFAVGQQTNTPVLDMETLTKNWLMALGPTNSLAYFAMDDNTHLIMQGAVAVAKLAVMGIRALGLPIAARALP